MPKLPVGSYMLGQVVACGIVTALGFDLQTILFAGLGSTTFMFIYCLLIGGR